MRLLRRGIVSTNTTACYARSMSPRSQTEIGIFHIRNMRMVSTTRITAPATDCLLHEVAYGIKGAITDDTQMTLFTAEALIRAAVRGANKGICNPIAVIHHAYLRWLQTQGYKSEIEVEMDAGSPESKRFTPSALPATPASQLSRPQQNSDRPPRTTAKAAAP